MSLGRIPLLIAAVAACVAADVAAAVSCAAQTTCWDCVLVNKSSSGAGCGFGDSSRSCVAGTKNGPLIGSCPAADWQFTQCPGPQPTPVPTPVPTPEPTPGARSAVKYRAGRSSGPVHANASHVVRASHPSRSQMY